MVELTAVGKGVGKGKKPVFAPYRKAIFLFELISFNGEWERAINRVPDFSPLEF